MGRWVAKENTRAGGSIGSSYEVTLWVLFCFSKIIVIFVLLIKSFDLKRNRKLVSKEKHFFVESTKNLTGSIEGLQLLH